MESDSWRSTKTSVRCSQIPKEYSINVSAGRDLPKKDLAYRNINRELNQTFADKHNSNEQDNPQKFQNLDLSNGNTKQVLGSVLIANVDYEQNDNATELLPRTRCNVNVLSPVPKKPLKQTPKQDTVAQIKTQKHANESETIGQYDDVNPHGSSSDSDYEEINDRIMSPDHVTIETHDYVDMSSKVHTTSQSFTNVTSDDHEGKTSDEDECYILCDSLLKRRKNDYENFVMMLEQTRKNRSELARRLKVCFGSRSKHDRESTSEVVMVGANNKNSDELPIRLESSHEKTQNASIITELTSMKPDRNNTPSNITLEPAKEQPSSSSTQTRSTVITCRPTVRFPNDKFAFADHKTMFDSPIPNDLSSLTVEGVGHLLASLNMECYAEKFENEQIDGEIFMELDETTLISLDLMPFHVRKLLKVIAGWRPHVRCDDA